jgi:putative transposase
LHKAFRHVAPRRCPTPVIRSDNGLVFQIRRFRAACRDYRLRQEFITPYTPEQNGLVERFFRSLKEECVWQHNFGDFAEALATITQWIRWYNAERPHQALGYRSPRQFRALQPQLVAYLEGALHLGPARSLRLTGNYGERYHSRESSQPGKSSPD